MLPYQIICILLYDSTACSATGKGVGEMTGLKQLAATFVAIAISSPSFACQLNSSGESARVREVQSMLMVGTLHCRLAKKGDFSIRYNNFVSKNQSTLEKHTFNLKRFFAVEDRGAFDRFNTRLADAYAVRATAPEFCSNLEKLLAAIETMPAGDFTRFSVEALPNPVVCFEE